MYNYNHLYYFYVTAKFGGVGAAAKHLRISQPSLSSQLKVLERTLDTRLLQRVGRRNQLTPAGSVIYGFCRQMFEISEEMGEVIAKRVPSVARRIHIGVSDEVDRPFVVEVVSRFLKLHGREQRPKVIVVSGTHEQLSERLRFRELDVVVTQLAMMDPDLANLQRAEVPVVLACSPHLKFTERLLLKNCGDSQWLMPSSRFKLRAEIDHFFEVNQVRGRIVFESDVIASLVRSVVDGVGVAFLPQLYIAREVQEKSIRTIGPKKGFWKYRVWLACHARSKEDSLIKALSRSFAEVSGRAS